MADEMRTVFEQLGHERAVGLRIVRAAGICAAAMSRPVGYDQLPTLVAQRPLRAEVEAAAGRAALTAAVNQDDPRARRSPALDVHQTGSGSAAVRSASIFACRTRRARVAAASVDSRIGFSETRSRLSMRS